MPLSSDIISYTEARNNLKAVMDKVWNDSKPVIITRAGGKPVVVMNKDDYDSMCETDYLLASPANAAALREAIAQVDAGITVPMEFDSKGRLVRANHHG